MSDWSENSTRTYGTGTGEGNTTSAALEKRLKHATNIDDFLNDNAGNMLNQSLTDYLNNMLAKKDLSVADVVRDSLLDRTYTYQIFDGRKKPSRDKLLAIAFGLKLSSDETKKMLKIAGYRELYPRDARDAIILFTIERGKKINDANDLLENKHFKLLGLAE